jgi:thiamine-phosphate pyrophosphorylase
MSIRGLYFITDRGLSRQGILKDAEQAIRGGASIVQYREKAAPTRRMVEEASALARICRQNMVLFLVDDRVDVALAVGADGVHLGQQDMPIEMARKLLGKGKIIGVTVHGPEEAKQAEKQRADYVSVAPVFETKTKQDAGKPLGVEMIKRVKAIVKVPLVAVGGINEANAAEVAASGADAIAVISAIATAPNVRRAAERLAGIMNDATRTG